LEFRSEAFRIDSGLDNRSLFFFIVDFAFSFEKVQQLLSSFVSELDENDSVVVMAVSGPTLAVMYSENGVPFFSILDSAASFEPTDLYEVNKEELSRDVLPSLSTLYELISSRHPQPVDIIRPIQIAVRQAEKEKFAVFFFLGSETCPVTVEMAAAAGKSVAAKGGVVHFGSTGQFKRLSAVCHASLGFVYGIAELVPSLIRRLMDGSKSLAITLVCPRVVEIEKVTGADGRLRVSGSLLKVKLKNVRGCSGRFQVDIGDRKVVTFMEIAKGVDGKFVSLHRFPVAESNEQFLEKLDETVTRNLVLKGFASDLLRGVWAGGDWKKALDKLVAKKTFRRTCLSDVGERDDRDAMRLYYVLECFCSDLINRTIKVEECPVFLAPPIAYVYSEQANVDLKRVEEAVGGEWPFEIRVFGDMDSFRAVVEKYGGSL
jgi:hypothetical protein